jgi:tetratricopeptide (TPR) repeat protein
MTRRLLAEGLARQKAGDRDGAEAIYRGLLDTEPANPDALHLLGLIKLERGENDAGARLLEQAIAARPGTAVYHGNFGNALVRLGRHDEAMSHYLEAIRLDPAFASGHNNLGNALRTRGQLQEAIGHYERACGLKPDFAEAWNNLGIAMTETRRYGEAIAAFERALVLRPDYPEALNNFGNALHESGASERAIDSFHRALSLAPEDAGAHNNLSIALHDLGRIDEAIAGYRRAVALKPDYAEAWNNLGSALADLCRIAEAVDCYRKALQLRPEYPGASYNLSNALLLRGELREGFRLYENRWEGTKDARGARRKVPCPQWEGGPLEGKSIFLHAEQGFGDTLQFVRYVSMVAARGARVVFECQPELKRLLASVPGVAVLLARGEVVPACDLHSPLLSLPLAFGTDLDCVPADVPYLHPVAKDVEAGAARFPDDGTLRVGVAWRGEPKNRNDRRRSLSLPQLVGLRAIGSIRLYSLQLGAASDELAAADGLQELVDLTDGIRDFADTAALMEHLDLIITVDTAIAHLAGALGKPVWMLCRFDSEWRWMLEREDSPWYPSMRIFRQQLPGDWRAAVERLTAALTEVAQNKVRTVPARSMREAQAIFDRGDLAGAQTRLRSLAVACPGAPDAANNLGCVLQARGQADAAAREYRRALALNPRFAGALNNLGTVRQELGDIAGAIRLYRRALAFDPGYAQARNNLGLALQSIGERAQARAQFLRAAESVQRYADPLFNLGNMDKEEGRFEAAAETYLKAIAADPEHARAHWNRGLALLYLGRYREGWDEYEWRWRSPDFRHLVRPFSAPQWDGRPLGGRTLLVHTEQGLGDTLQFVRFLEPARKRVGRIVLECQPELAALLAGCAGVDAVVARGQALPQFDVRIALLGVPRVLGTEPDTAEVRTPYLHVPGPLLRAARERVAATTALRVGLVWRGDPSHPADARRSIPAHALSVLSDVPGVRYHSLQKRPPTSPPDSPAITGLIDLEPLLATMAQTAALIEHLDLVVTVDTAVAHLAGGLGKPVWLLCRHESEWRWMLDREDSPWYPTMRIFREPAPGAWPAVLETVRLELERAAGAALPASPSGEQARALFEQGRFAEAERVVRVFLAQSPGNGSALSDLAVIVGALGRTELSVSLCQRALERDPTLAPAHYNLGNALRDLNRPREAIASYREAIRLRKDYAKAWNNMGLALKELDELAQARGAFEQALALQPAMLEAWVNRGEVLRIEGAFEEAERCFRRCLQLQPDSPDGHWNLGVLLLMQGDYAQGWDQYEWRWRLPELRGMRREIDVPRWAGEDLTGRTLLLTTEQGLGDEIMFSSVVPEIAARAGTCMLECSSRLAPAFARSFPGVVLLPVDRTRDGWERQLASLLPEAPQPDFQVPLGSLPAALRRSVKDFPSHRGFLRADPAKVARWAGQLADLGSGLKLGLSWRGGTLRTGLHRRSMELATLTGLFDQPGVHFVSLQYTDCRDEMRRFTSGSRHTLTHWQEAIDDYDETAALVSALDGVVTVCTAVAHLAGALGRPVWVMAPKVPEWRYGMAGESMPWYPSVTMLRQGEVGQWEPVVMAVRDRIALLASTLP